MIKKSISFLIVLAISLSSFAQEKVTNVEGSKYSFTPIAHLDATPVLSQGRTGTCWSFSALSFFESEMIRKGFKNPPILSKMYIVRKAYEGKADHYVRLDGKGNFSQGGAFHDIPYVFRNYGIVPEVDYPGLSYGMTDHNHNELYKVLNGYVEGVVSYANSKGNVPLTSTWKQGMNGILDAYLGKDPEKFTYEGKEYTPKSFAEYTKLNMDDYVSLTSYKDMPLHSKVQLLIQDNWLWDSAYNLTLDELLETAVYALKNGYTIAWGADVSEKGFNFRKGLAIIPEDESTIRVDGKDNQNFSDAGAAKEADAFLSPVKELTITPEMRQAAYDNKTTTDDHGMHITGLYKEDNGTLFFLVKNSWGTGNYPEGFLYVSENYFKYKTMNIYIHKDGIPKNIKSKLGLK